MDAEQGGSHIVRLRGAGGIVDSIVASVLADVTQPPSPCSHTDCCELSDDAALEVFIMMHCRGGCLFILCQ